MFPSREGRGRHNPVIRSRPEGFGHSERYASASARNGSGALPLLANCASVVAELGVPIRKLALRTRRNIASRGPGTSGVPGGHDANSGAREMRAANCDMAASIDPSLIARAASTAIRGSLSWRNCAISGRCSRRITSSAAIRTAGELSRASGCKTSICFVGGWRLTIPDKAITPAWRI